MTLSDFSIRRPVFAWILMFALIFFGMISFTKMGVNENPDVEFPTISIRYSYEGATPEVIEKDVLEPSESVLVSMQGIRTITATANRGSGRIQLEFELDVDIDFALQEVNTLLSRAQRLLPDELDPPVVTKSNADDSPILYLAMSTETLSQRDMMIVFRDQIQDRISTVKGVAEVRAFGFHEPVLRIDLDAEKLKKYDLTAGDIVSTIQREHKELPAGKFESGDSESQIRILGEAESVDEFANMVISRRGGSPTYVPIRLKDVGTVYEGIENIRRISRVNGVPGMAMAVQKQRGVNSVATADAVIERMKEINKALPEGTKISVNFNTTQFVKESVDELVFTLVLSALLTSLVCWLFIGSWSATINILLAIPTAIIGTFIFINWLGFTLNTFSLLGLALAIGVVVDDAVVMLENIIRYVQKGYDRVNAAFKGAREISFAVIATTVALISIFVPILFMPGIEGRFFVEFAVTIAIAVALSSLEALTLAPMRCSQFLTVGERVTLIGKIFEESFNKLKSGYESALDWVFQRPKTILVTAVVLFGGSLFLVKYLPTEFAPAQDRGAMFVIFKAPDGKSMQYTSRKVVEFEEIAMKHPGVKRIFVAVGGFGGGGRGNEGNGVVILKNADDRKQSQFEVAEDLREASKSIEGMRVFIRDRTGGSIGGRRGSPIEFTIFGPDAEKQKEIFRQFEDKLNEDGRVVGIRSDDVVTLPEVHIVPDRSKATESGVEVDQIANVVNSTFAGVTAGQYTTSGRRFDILVQLNSEDQESIGTLDKILVRNNRGQTVPLSSVVEVKSSKGPSEIYRENRVRGTRLDANLAKGVKSGEVVRAIKNWSGDILPPRYSIRFETTPDDKLFEGLFVMLMGLLIAYMVLAIQFNSFVDPFIVFLAVPFGVTGSLIALLLGGETLNVYSAIGIMLTMGIVKKNSILLVEFSNQLRDMGLSVLEAVREACRERFRPIMMTNMATVSAAIPPALAFGPGAETRVPMALTVIGGVLISLFFTLFVVPIVYTIISPKRVKIEETD